MSSDTGRKDRDKVSAGKLPLLPSCLSLLLLDT